MKYSFSKDSTNLIITLDTESGKYAPEVTSLNDPNITLENGSFWIYENGKFLRFLSFDQISTIDGVIPSNVDDAFTKLNTIINTLHLLASPKFKGTAVPTDTPTGTEDAFWIASQAGTYTNFGGVVVSVNSRAEISRVSGVFTISQTPLDITSKVNVSDVINSLTSTETTKPLSAAQGKLLNEKNIKIEPWTAKLYASGNQVNYLGKDWVANAAIVAGDAPGTSSKWVERLSAYNFNKKINNTDNSVIFDSTLSIDTVGMTVSCTANNLFTRNGVKQITAQSVTLIDNYSIIYIDVDKLLKCVLFSSYVDTEDNIIVARISKNAAILSLEYSCCKRNIFNGITYDNITKNIETSVNTRINNSNFQIINPNSTNEIFTITTDLESTNCTVSFGLIQFFSYSKFAQIPAGTVTFANNANANLYLVLNLTALEFRIINYTTALNKVIANDDVLIGYISYTKATQKLFYQAFCDEQGVIWNGKRYKYGKEIVNYDTQLTTIKGYQRAYEFTNNIFKFTVNSTTQRLEIKADVQFFTMNRNVGNTGYIYAPLVDQTFDFTTDYNYLMFDPVTKVFFFKIYNTYSQTELQNYLLLGVFYITKTNCYGQLYSGNKFSINGVSMQSGDTINLSSSSSIKYGEIGDSITDKDSKYETNFDYTGSLTGYMGKGYGRYICEKLGITYENHFPQGKNGRTTADYWDEIVAGHVNFPTDIDFYTSLLGTNDWGTERHPLGTKDDYLNNTYTPSNRTSYGAYRKIVEYVFGAKTEGKKTPKLILMTPLQRGVFGYTNGGGVPTGAVKSAIMINPTTNEYEYTTNSYGFTLKDVADMVIWIADREGLGLVDFFNEGFIEKRNLNMAQTWTGQPSETGSNGSPKAYQDLLYDNLHPTDKGHRLIASGLLEEINKKVSKFTI